MNELILAKIPTFANVDSEFDVGDSMQKKKNEPKAKVAYIQRLVHDQGGGSVCGNCDEYLGSVPGDEPEFCPKCKRKLVETGGSPFINPGGSDF